MQVEWKYFKDNFGTDNCIAVMQNADGICILQVYEERKFHVAIPSRPFSFFEVSYVPHIEEWQYVKDNFPDAVCNDLLMKEKCVEYACKEFERKFNEHALKLLSLLS